MDSSLLAGAPGQEAMYTSRALQALDGCKKVEVKEKVNRLEAITALLGSEVEMANKYKILTEDGEEIMFAVEKTDFLTRQLKQCCGDCAAWQVDILYTQGGVQETAFKIDRPWSATCCCINRPVMTMSDANGQVLGKMRDPFACCDLTFRMQDPAGKDVLLAKGGCCQPGMCCPLPCGPCSQVSFPVVDASTGADVGHIQKKVPSCCKFLFASDVDNYKIDFGGVQNPQWKALMVGLSIFIDFRYFTDNKAGNNN